MKVHVSFDSHPDLEAMVKSDAKDLALSIPSVIRMRIKERYDQMRREEMREADAAMREAEKIKAAGLSFLQDCPNA